MLEPRIHFDQVSGGDYEWRGASVDAADDDELLADTPEYVVEMLGFDPLESDTGDGFDPDQPRDDTGKWTSEGVPSDVDQDVAVDGVKQYLEMVSGIRGDQPSVAKFVLEHGRSYRMTGATFTGPKGAPKLCFMNAAMTSMDDPSKIYVEGYVTVHGIPIEHAWVADKQGLVVDPTIRTAKGIGGYFGVAFGQEYLRETLLKNKVYGLLSHESYKTLLPLIEGKVNFRDYDPDQPRDKDGQWTTGGHVMHADLAAQSVTGKSSESDLAAIDSYLEYQDFEELQVEMRSGRNHSNDQLVKDLKSAIGKSSLSQDVELYRGVSEGEDNFGRNPGKALVDKLEKLSPGDVIVDKGFMSTSLSRSQAGDYGPEGTGLRGAMIVVRARKGDIARPIVGRDSHPMGSYWSEVLFPPNTLLKYVGKRDNGDYVFDTLGKGTKVKDAIDLFDFDPNQPRDLLGQWTAGGGDLGSASSEVLAKLEKAQKIADSIPRTDEDNSPARQVMRKHIEDLLYNTNISNRTHGRNVTMILGLPGAGKSVLAKPLVAAGTLEIDPDLVKEHIPEFAGGVGSAAVHEESSMINRKILERAIASGDDVVWPRIDGGDRLVRDVKSMAAMGYKVHVKFIDVSLKTAVLSALDRFVATGRLVSPVTVLAYGSTAMESYEAAKATGLLTSAEEYKREHGQGVERVGS